jgi:hypothetical protein
MCCSCSSRLNTGDLQMLQLRGKVKTLTETHYKATLKNGKWVQGELKYHNYNTKMYFDEAGNLYKNESYNEAQELQETIIIFRKNGKIIEEKRYDGKGNRTGEIKILAHTDDKMQYQDIYLEGTVLSEGSFIFENGVIVKHEINIPNQEDSLAPRKTTLYLSYDDHYLVKNTHKDESGEILSVIRYTYEAFDAHKNWTKQREYLYEDSDKPSTIVIRTYEYYED